MIIPLIKYIRVDGLKVLVFPTAGAMEFISDALAKRSDIKWEKTTEPMAGVKVDAIAITIPAPIRNFEFKQNFKTNLSSIFVFTESESGITIPLPTTISIK